MDTPDLLTPFNPQSDSEPSNTPGSQAITISSSANDDCSELQEHVMENIQKPNVPNVNVPERIVLCLDVCFDNNKSLYRLGDGSTFTPINMMKRVIEFFLHSKSAINKKTEFAIIVLKGTEAVWIQNFTSNIKDILGTIEYLNPEECTSEIFDMKNIFNWIRQKVEIPEYKDGESTQPPPYVVRLLVFYVRSNCIPIIPQNEAYYSFLKKQLYFYIDILLAHEEECSVYKCEEVYDALQDLDNGYSYVFEVSRNATKIHDCIAKLLAHPLQRPLQKNTDYTFGAKN
ncbi:hypothetical protein SFRURICE_000102 [Spodoptera frugiperda]|uniref:BRISC and BRCA1-A complex member 1 n=1 Tax=Spodoptera frugiperda TaxID=7108 RepID=A0A2H1WQY7_SPOFR|nr:hypothetical protein SFRURICE_000102 [Spodoptera frugiperda]